jgi:hypothetical protein
MNQEGATLEGASVGGGRVATTVCLLVLQPQHPRGDRPRRGTTPRVAILAPPKVLKGERRGYVVLPISEDATSSTTSNAVTSPSLLGNSTTPTGWRIVLCGVPSSRRSVTTSSLPCTTPTVDHLIILADTPFGPARTWMMCSRSKGTSPTLHSKPNPS